MTIKHELEIAPKNEGEDYLYLNVEFEGDCSWTNDGIGPYEFWGYKGYDKGEGYVICEGFGWDEKKHTPEECALIKEWLEEEDNYTAVEDALCEAYEKSCRDYHPDY
jgi:hypothetical protein